MNKAVEKSLVLVPTLLRALFICSFCLLFVAAAAAEHVDDDNQIGFIWEPPINAQVAVRFYHVYIAKDGGNFERGASTSDLFYIVEADSGSSYRIYVVGVNEEGEEGCPSPESDEVLCLPQESTPVVFEFAAAESWQTSGQLKIVWETTGYLLPSAFQIRRKSYDSQEEYLLDVEVSEDLNSDSGLYRYWCMDRDAVVGESYRYTILAADPSGYGILAISICAEVKGPGDYRLFQNYPNPFNAETALSYQNPEASRVVLNIFNARGQKVNALHDGYEAPGFHVVYWDGTDQAGFPVASGIYFCQIWCGDFIDVKKMTVIR